MRHSLNAVERSSRQKRLTLSEMPNLPTRKIDQVVRTSRRGSNVAPAQRNPASSVVDRPRRDSHKRSRAIVPMGGASSRFPRQDPSISPAPPRKRGRPTNEERLRRERKDGKRPSVPSRGTSAESVRLLSSQSSNRRGRPSDRPGLPKLCSSQSISGAAIDPELFESIQHQGPQRQTRKRPIDCEKHIKVIIGEGRRECATRITNGSANRCRLAPARPAAPTPPAGTSTVPEVNDQKISMENREACSTVRVAHPPGRASPSPSRNGISRTSTGSARRFAARSVSTRTRARGTASSPGRRGTPTSNSCGVSSVPFAVPAAAAVAAVNSGAAAVAASGAETGASGSGSSTVIVPSFRLLNPVGTIANENSETSILQGESAGRPGDGNRDSPLSAPAIGARRKRPVGKVIPNTGAKSIAPPHPRPYPPQSEVAAGAGGQGFLELTKDALVRSTHVFFGSDYDMDDIDEEFLQGLNGEDNGVVAEEDWKISRDLFEAMIERLERQESRARDTQVLVEASERLRADYHDATARVISLTQEADSVRFAGDSNSKSIGARNGRTSTCGGNSNGGDDVNGRKTHDKKGHAYVYEEDSDSDEGESQARIMRGRGPAILSAEFALSLLRSCVAKHRERDGDDKGGGGDGSGAGASRAKKGKAPTTEAGRSRCGEEAEVSDSKLLAVFGYWTRKREAYGGPILRCFHAFMMNLWKRMDDPQREAEDLEEGRDPHASLEAFKTLRSFRQDLDKARLVVDCVKRREKLKRSATRYANSIWKIVDETQDAPRPSRPPVAPLSSSSSSSFASSSQSRSFPAGLERPSTRGRTAAVAAAAEGLHDEEAFYGGSDEEENLQRQRPRAMSVRAAWAKSKAGCAEQEQAWNALARLPARGWHAGGENWRGGSLGNARTCGRVTRGKKRVGDVSRRDEDGVKRGGGGGGGASGLFALRDAFAKRSNGVVPASGSGDGQELRSGGRGRRLPLDSAAAAAAVTAPQAEAGEEHENHQDEEGRNADTQVYHDLPQQQQQQQQQQSVANTRRKFPVVVGAASHPQSSSGARSSKVVMKGTAEEAEPQPEPEPPAEQPPTVPDGRRKSRRRRQLPRVCTAVAPCLVPQSIASTHEGGRQPRHGGRREYGSGQQPTEKDPEEEGNVVGEEVMSGERGGGASNGLPAPETRGIGGQAAITTSAVGVAQSPAAGELELAPSGEQGHKGGGDEDRRIITRRLSRRCDSLAPPPPLPLVPPRSRRAATGPGTKRGPFEEKRDDEALDVVRAVAETGVSNEGVPVRVTRSSKRSKIQTRAGCSSEPEAAEPGKNPVAKRASEGHGGVSKYGRVRRARVKEDATRALKSESSQRDQRADRGMYSLRNLS